MEIFVERLKLLRKQKNVTQKQLAEAINTGERNVRSYEINEKLPSLENAVKIADYFDVSLDYLTGRKDEM